MTEAYISTRCKKILYMIMASDTYVSLPQISEEFKLSKRSIYYELCKINDWLSVQGINEITVVRGKGIKLTEEEKQQIFSFETPLSARCWDTHTNYNKVICSRPWSSSRRRAPAAGMLRTR